MCASRQTRRALPMRDTWPQQGRPIVSVSWNRDRLFTRPDFYPELDFPRDRRCDTLRRSMIYEHSSTISHSPSPSPSTPPLQNRVLNDVATGVLVDFCIVLLSCIVVWNFENFDTVPVYNWTELKYCGCDFAFHVIESHDHAHNNSFLLN